MIELGFMLTSKQIASANFEPEWAIGLFGHILAWIQKLRSHSVVLSPEYAIRAEIVARNVSMKLGRNDPLEGFFEDHAREVQGIDTTLRDVEFPTYSFGIDEDVPSLLVLFQRDLHNWLSLDVSSDYEDLKIVTSTF